MIHPMRSLLVAVALVTIGCGDSPTAPERVYTANLALANGPTLGVCAGPSCAFTVAVINNGPDCAQRVAVSILLNTPPSPGRLNGTAVGVSAQGIVRAGQVVTLSGSDWPANGSSPTVTVTGAGAACP